MAGWASWAALIGGIIAIIAQFWENTIFLAAIGGVIAAIGGIGAMMK